MKKTSIFKLFRLLKKFIPLIICSLLLSIIYVLCILIIPIIIGNGIDGIVSKGNVNYDILKESFVKIIVITCVIVIVQWLMTIVNNKITYSVCMDIRKKSIRKIQKLPLKYIDRNSYGDVVSRVINDVDQFSDGLLMGFNQLFIGVLTIVGTLVIMLTINVLITILVAILTPISLFVAKFIATKSFKYFQAQSEIKGKQTAFIDEMIVNQKVVQAFSMEEKNNEKFDEINDELRVTSLKAIFFSSLTNPCTRFVNSLVYAVVCLAGSITCIINPLFTVGSLSALLSYANQYTKPFNEISSVIAELQNAFASFGRVYEFLEEDEEDPNSSNDFGKNIIPKMLNDGKRLFAYPFSGYWKDVGTISSLWEANMDLLGKNPNFDIFDKNWKIYTRNAPYPPHFVAKTGEINNSLVSSGSYIEGKVINSLIGLNVIIKEGAVVENSIILDNVVINKGARINYSIIAEDAVIGENAKIAAEGKSSSDITVVANSVKIGKNVVIGTSEMIEKDVEE